MYVTVLAASESRRRTMPRGKASIYLQAPAVPWQRAVDDQCDVAGPGCRFT